MKSKHTIPLLRSRRLLALCALTGSFLFPLTTGAAGVPALIDDFSNAERTTAGATRPVITDKDLGGKSQATARCENGIFAVDGTLVPARGMPAFVSVPLLLSSDAKPRDLSGFEGVRLRVKIDRGILSVQASSSDVENFDFHISAPIARQPGAFREIRIPFSEMKRAWSEQTPLNLKTITSVNLVAAGMAPGDFAYEVDEIGFY